MWAGEWCRQETLPADTAQARCGCPAVFRHKSSCRYLVSKQLNAKNLPITSPSEPPSDTKSLSGVAKGSTVQHL